MDTYAVLGPWLVTPDEIPSADDLDLTLTVNAGSRQKATTSDLIVGVPELISWASQYYTLKPGDVLLTGTPEGVGPVVGGDLIHATIERIGEIRVRVTSAAAAET